MQGTLTGDMQKRLSDRGKKEKKKAAAACSGVALKEVTLMCFIQQTGTKRGNLHI